MSEWTDQQIETLKQVWPDNSAARAMEYLPGRTRNSIIGKARRLGLANKQVGRLGKNPVVKVYKPRPIVIKPQTEPVVNSPPEGPWIPFMRSNDRTCRAIMIDHGDDDLAMFCSTPKELEHSFCPYHLDIYYQPIKRSA